MLPALLAAADRIDYRAMILIYLVLHQPQFTEYDAHYFPETEIPISRLSEPKNYSKVGEPADRTVLCAELPCSPEDPQWTMGDDELGREVEADLVMHLHLIDAHQVELDRILGGRDVLGALVQLGEGRVQRRGLT